MEPKNKQTKLQQWAQAQSERSWKIIQGFGGAALGAAVSFFLSGGTSDDTVYAIYALLLALLVPKFIEQGCGRRVDFGRNAMLVVISLFIVSALIMHYA
jgi:hypothetical protein